MAKQRLLFVKEGRSIYLSHLDLLRTLQRIFLRSGVSLLHTQGFHPHPILSLALPLPVGQASQCELLDFETVEEIDQAAMPDKLNYFTPEGVRVLACYPAVRPVRELASIRCKVDFLYSKKELPGQAKEPLEECLKGNSLVIQKRTKRKAMADIDIRPLIRSVTATVAEDFLSVDCIVAAQNPGLNPALLARAVEKYRPEWTPDFIRVRRIEVLDTSGKMFR